jgi:hypothetical protein
VKSFSKKTCKNGRPSWFQLLFEVMLKKWIFFSHSKGLIRSAFIIKLLHISLSSVLTQFATSKKKVESFQLITQFSHYQYIIHSIQLQVSFTFQTIIIGFFFILYFSVLAKNIFPAKNTIIFCFDLIKLFYILWCVFHLRLIVSFFIEFLTLHRLQLSNNLMEEMKSDIKKEKKCLFSNNSIKSVNPSQVDNLHIPRCQNLQSTPN